MIDLLDSPIISIDVPRHKLFIKSQSGPLIACELLFTETLKESLQNPMDVKIYYDGFTTRHVPEISSKFGTCSFNDLNAIEISREKIFKLIGSHCYPFQFFINWCDIQFEKVILHRCGLFESGENVTIQVTNNEFIIDDIKMCCYVSGVISQSIAQILYVLQHSEKLIIANSEMLYHAKKSASCDISKYYLKMKFSIDFYRRDNVITFTHVALNLYS